MIACKEPFLAFIMEEAVRQTGKAFLPDTAEGRWMENPPDGLEVEDWSGRLVPIEEQEQMMDCAAEPTEEIPLVWVSWFQKDDGSIGVEFEIL